MPWVSGALFLTGCAHAIPHSGRMGAWGTIAPRFYRDRVARDEATLLVEAPTCIVILEHVRKTASRTVPGIAVKGTPVVFEERYSLDTLHVVHPLGLLAHCVDAGRHRLLIAGPDRHDWAPEVTMFLLAFDFPIAIKEINAVLGGIDHHGSPISVRQMLEQRLGALQGGARWEGFYYRVDMYAPDRP